MSQPGATLQVFSAKTPGEPVGTVALCTRDHINAATATALLMTDFGFVRPGESVSRITVQGSILTLQRNDCLRRMEGDWILFIDDDMLWQPEAVGQLVTSWMETRDKFAEPVVMGALCHRRAAPFDPTLYMRAQPNGGGYRFLEKWDTDLVEVDATGLAFLLIPTEALEAIIRAPWPKLEERMAHEVPPPIFRWEGTLGEDLRFCQEARAAGVHIIVDTRIEIGHVAELTIGSKDFLKEIALRSPTDEARVREANDALGLPTLSAAEAKARLRWT